MLGLELLVTREINSLGVSVCLKPSAPEVITPTLVKELRRFQNSLVDKYFSSPWENYFYVVWYSHRDHGICGRGLDFNYILNAILNHKEADFESYIRDVFDLLFLNYIGLGLPLINCSIVDREVTGISQEFFFLNRINFIKNYSQDVLATEISPVEVTDISNRLVFPSSIYQRNLYYKFCYFDLNSMRRLIAKTHLNPLNEDFIENIKSIFNNMQYETVNEIYNLASKNLKVLKRLAKKQLSSL
ncbi:MULTISPECIES: hypothetical protein [unclassified Legionella]|uniref:hypothetical protein n=1 Tax=unclassified Legionella TaxID=2622702 RepID=UPI0010563C98|nr:MULTISPECIES: hypothetical protein [unclassified Legionella]MDI9819165.1 hypothetical protein [Legionella sp. PL877]